MRDRIIAIGDIHGCSQALECLIAAINPAEKDTVVVLGDVINRGPDSRGVIEQLMELRAHCKLIAILGNHEEMLLASLESKSEFRYWMMFGGEETLKSYGSNCTLEDIPTSHIGFINTVRQWYETEEFIFVHAFIDPRLPLDRQSGTRLRWNHLEPADAMPHCSGKTVVMGHTPQANGQVLDLGHLVCIDTSCHEGGWLTAMDVRSGQIWQSNQSGEVREMMR